MADYKELIRKAIQALPENNGAARRAVYEKARAALVGQLRGLNPPLAARDITQHRLQLEDCIRQVEQEASEAVIAGLKQNEEVAPPPKQPALPPPRAANSVEPPRAANSSNGTRPAANVAARPPAASRAAASSATPRPLSQAPRSAPAARPSPAPKPQGPQALPRVAASQPKSAAAVATAPSSRPVAAVVRPIPRSQTATYPRAVPAPDPEPDVEPEETPDTIADIIAAAEEASAPSNDVDEAVVDEIETADAADEADDVEEPPPPPPMFKLEPRPAARKPALAAPPAERTSTADRAPAPERTESRPLPSIVARAEAAKAGRSTAKPSEPAKRVNGLDRGAGDAQPLRPQGPGRQQPEAAPAIGRNNNAAMSTVREVDLEPTESEGDPQIAIERAIATLEREARNDGEGVNGVEAELPNGRSSGPGRRRQGADKGLRDAPANADTGFVAPESERGGGSAVTIFLLVFLVLLVAAGGGGFWAWREGFIDFDAMFGRTQQVADQGTPTTVVVPPKTQVTPAAPAKPAPSTPAAQTNTETAPNVPAQSAEQMSAAPDADTPDTAATPAPSAAPEPSAQTGAAPKSEERLSQSTDAVPAPAAGDASKPAADAPATAATAGSQSLLLEASQDGTTGAVPFSGTVEWSKGTDEMGQPTLVGKANIPARNLGVSVLIRKNSDPTLPASHLMEINFTVNDSFIGGAISGLPGVLLKNEELVQGTPLVGASARVVGNSFLFALSSSPADEATNKDLLTSRKWIDLAIIYATGKKAIITLEKDDKTEAMFNDVFAAWSKEAAATPAPAAAATPAK